MTRINTDKIRKDKLAAEGRKLGNFELRILNFELLKDGELVSGG
jgi:hypothetical protein